MNQKFLKIFLFFQFAGSLYSQVFWTEPFNTACVSNTCIASGYVSTNGTWTQTNSVTATDGTKPNTWYVSCHEDGLSSGGCGSDCVTSDPSLHVSSAVNTLFCNKDCGAAYNATGATNVTSRRIESPVINATGQTGIFLDFDYIEMGEGTNDNATIYYSTNSGTSWTLLVDPAKTSCCDCCFGGGPSTCDGLYYAQGSWTHSTISLPSACDNCSTLKIAFLWVNNGNGVGTDPSFAVDDLSLSVTVMLGINEPELIAFEENGKVKLQTTIQDIVNDKTDETVIEKSVDGINFNPIHSSVNPSLSESFTDENFHSGINYYRTKQIFRSKKYAFSRIVAITQKKYNFKIFPNPAGRSDVIRIVSAENLEGAKTEILSPDGVIVCSGIVTDNLIALPQSGINSGIYYCKIYKGDKLFVEKLLIE